MKSLGGRSPYEVVTGLRPKLPTTLVGKFPVREITVDEYVEGLLDHLRLTYTRVKQLQSDAVEESGMQAPGSLERERRGGVLVMRRLMNTKIM